MLPSSRDCFLRIWGISISGPEIAGVLAMSRNIWLFYCCPDTVGPSSAPCTWHDAGRAEEKVKFKEKVLGPGN